MENSAVESEGTEHSIFDIFSNQSLYQNSGRQEDR